MQSVGKQLGLSNLEVFRPCPALVTNDAVGVELELEGFTSESIRTAGSHLHPLWVVTTDGSLRNGGVEFITNGGIGGERLFSAYERMVSLLDRVNYDASWRCSTHMHINMLDFTVNQVARFMMVYAACEPVIFKHCGAFRRSSNFCTPVGDSIPFHKALIARLYDDAVESRGAAHACNKYTALNFLPLFGDGRTRALGTVEFRGGRPMVSLDDLVLQTNLLLSIKQFVRSFEGTEEAMLTRLMDGVGNVVFLNGIAESLPVCVQELEDAMINSWLLLKSYQEGMQAPRMAPPLPRRTGSLSSPAVDDWGPPPVSEGVEGLLRMLDSRGFYSSGSCATRFTMRRTDYTAEDILTDPDVCPRLSSNLAELQTVGVLPRRALDYAFHVMTDPVNLYRLPQDQANKALAMWMLSKDVTEEVTPVGTIKRAISQRQTQGLMGSTPAIEMIERGKLCSEQPKLANVTDHNLDYKRTLPASAWSEIASHIGIRVGTLTNRRIWDFLMNSHVDIKSPLTLRNHLEANTGITHVPTGPQQVTHLHYLFRWARRTSAQHLRQEWLVVYDRISAVIDILHGHGLSVPVVYSREGRNRTCYLGNLNGSIGWRITESQNTRATTARISPTTGRQVY